MKNLPHNERQGQPSQRLLYIPYKVAHFFNKIFKYILFLINLGLQIKIPSKIYLYHKIPPRSKLPGQTL